MLKLLAFWFICSRITMEWWFYCIYFVKYRYGTYYVEHIWLINNHEVMMLRYLFCILSNIDTISTMMSLDRVALTVRSFVYGDSSLSRCIDNDWHFVPGHWIYIYLDICIYWIYICIVTYIFNKVFHCFTITIFFLKDQGINILKSSQNGRLRLSP